MANTKIYIHEFVDIILQNRAAYIMHMTEGWEAHRPRAQHEVLRRLGHGGQQ